MFAIEAQNVIGKVESMSVAIPRGADSATVVRLATQVRPSYRQIDYQQREMLGFIHIGMNTFTGAEWGTGKESPSIFNPDQLDAEEWVKTFKNAGITGVILVAKHHDGFCVWPSRYTDHTVAYSPWRGGKGDLVKEVADACRKYQMKLCLYLSPWDMHEKTYGTKAYNDYYINQIRELLTGYGPVYLLWFDGAGTTKSVSGHDMPFDWERIFSEARKIQPDVILSGNAPDVRWVGNEKGRGRETEWCVQGINNSERLFGSLVDYDPVRKDLGSIADLMNKKRLVWYPSRGGLPIRRGWFYNERDDDDIRSLQYLIDSYFSTVGQNSNLLPNMSPDKSGRFPKKDTERLLQFGRVISDMKRIDYADGATFETTDGWVGVTKSETLHDGDPFTSWHTEDGVTHASFVVKLKAEAEFNVIKLQENVRDFGQRIERFAVDAWEDDSWREIAQSTTVGFRKMIRLACPVKADRLRVRILGARVSVSIGEIALYHLEDMEDDAKKAMRGSFIAAEDMKLTAVGLTGKDTHALCDNDKNTIWCGRLKTKKEHAFVFALKKKQRIAGLSYIPQEGGAHIDYYSIYTSSDGVHWNKCVDGRFGNIMNNPVEQFVGLNNIETGYIKLRIDKLTDEDNVLNIQGLRLLK